MLETLRRDSARYRELGGWFRSTGFWVGAMYRFGAWARKVRNPLFRYPLLALHLLALAPWRIILNVNIYTDRIGPGLCLIHPRNIVIGPGVQIGEDCLVFHEVTVATGPTPGRPRIGNRVDLYVGARILGGITVGDGSIIGANCVVTRSVPPNSVVLAPPAKILNRALVARGEEAGSAPEPAPNDKAPRSRAGP